MLGEERERSRLTEAEKKKGAIMGKDCARGDAGEGVGGREGELCSG